MAEQEDDEFEDMQDEAAAPSLVPEVAPGRTSSTETAGDRSAPRAARFGEGPEGQAARRERNLPGPRTGPLERAGSFWRDVRAELKRVTWPTLKEVQQTTIITIIAVIFFAAYLWGVDRILAFVITQLESVANRLFG
ncbi:MAG TPA: preprotein translocase subunit SecE [Pyrinomonadaceae bacterium]|nr:preprotein translocase subunit SecE [Pyrinomonadaceae bacterium]